MPKYCKCIPRDLTKKFVRNEIIKNNDPKIIVAPGGMCDYGQQVCILKNLFLIRM